MSNLEVESEIIKKDFYHSNKLGWYLLMQLCIHGEDFFVAQQLPEKVTGGFERWIPVTERLPDKDGRFLVCKQIFNGIWVDVLSFAKDGREVDEYDFAEEWEKVWYFYDSEYGHIVCDSVTHWMPLPEPPEEDNNG